MIVALCAPVLLIVVGFAVDYGYVTYIKQGLDDAANAAALASVSQSAIVSGGGNTNTAWLTSYGLDVFQGNVSRLPISAVAPTLTVQSNGKGGITSDVTYSYNVPTFFGGLLGASSTNVSGHAQATSSPTTYINYYIIVDISQSMGVGATAADMSALYSRVVAYGNGSDGEAGCTFGCHVAAPGQKYTNEYLAHSVSPKITLRIDSAVSAIQQVIALANTNAGSAKNIKIGLYTMNKDPSTANLVSTISIPSSNYSDLSSTANSIDLGNNNSGGTGDSDLTNQLTTFNTLIPANGTGTSSASPLNYVFIITDGVIDTPGECTSGHCTAAFNQTICKSLKAKSTVGVIYTTYLPIYSGNIPAFGLEQNYAALVSPFITNVPTSLSGCASSPAYYFEAKDGPAITTAMNALFSSTYQSARLSR
jgi:Flp pilus assembly protein TadG